MPTIAIICIGIASLLIFLWLLIPSSHSDLPADFILNPSDSRAIGMLIGLFGGDVQDAAVARFALKRFQEEHGRNATVKDAGVVVGLMQSLDIPRSESDDEFSRL